jgi:molecular chaperone GrpE
MSVTPDDILTGTVNPADGSGGDDLSKLKKERDELFERLARATADFKNTTRRLETDADQRVQYANSGMIKQLIPVLDNLDRALSVDVAKTDAASLLSGVKLVADQLATTLKALNVEVIVPALGSELDPTRHEVIMQQPSELPAGSVSLVIEKGYAMHGRTLRAAKVAVAKGRD